MFLNSLHCNIASCCELAAQFEAKDTKKGFHLQGQYQGLKKTFFKIKARKKDFVFKDKAKTKETFLKANPRTQL